MLVEAIVARDKPKLSGFSYNSIYTVIARSRHVQSSCNALFQARLQSIGKECAGEAGNEAKYESVASLALSVIHLSYG